MNNAFHCFAHKLTKSRAEVSRFIISDDYNKLLQQVANYHNSLLNYLQLVKVPTELLSLTRLTLLVLVSYLPIHENVFRVRVSNLSIYLHRPVHTNNIHSLCIFIKSRVTLSTICNE